MLMNEIILKTHYTHISRYKKKKERKKNHITGTKDAPLMEGTLGDVKLPFRSQLNMNFTRKKTKKQAICLASLRCF